MPKETIRDTYYGMTYPIIEGQPVTVGSTTAPSYIDVDPGGSTVGFSQPEYRYVAVRWDRTGIVTVDTADAIDRGVEGVFGPHVHLDRDGINRLIRALRKARDQAFGADA